MLLWLAIALADPTHDEAPTFGNWLGDQRAPRTHPELATDYRFVGQAFWDIGVAMDADPDVVTTEVIGWSTEDRPIWAFHIGDPADHDRSVLVFAGLHALEWIGTEVATDLLLESIAHPPDDVFLTVIPLANPDGRAKVERDLTAGNVELYRRGNGPNVDLNRDFAVHRDARSIWRHILPGYHSTSPGPMSQPETRALDALAGEHRYTRAVSLHSFGGFIYHPWSGRWRRPDAWRDFVTLGHEMERHQGRRAYRTRQLSRWGFFFRAHGSEIDHLYGRYDTRAFLIELTRSGIRPLRLRRDRKTPFRWYNPTDPDPHVEQGLEALRALVAYPRLPTENGPVR